jgi:hypothetical protein
MEITIEVNIIFYGKKSDLLITQSFIKNEY